MRLRAALLPLLTIAVTHCSPLFGDHEDHEAHHHARRGVSSYAHRSRSNGMREHRHHARDFDDDFNLAEGHYHSGHFHDDYDLHEEYYDYSDYDYSNFDEDLDDHMIVHHSDFHYPHIHDSREHYEDMLVAMYDDDDEEDFEYLEDMIYEGHHDHFDYFEDMACSAYDDDFDFGHNDMIALDPFDYFPGMTYGGVSYNPSPENGMAPPTGEDFINFLISTVDLPPRGDSSGSPDVHDTEPPTTIRIKVTHVSSEPAPIAPPAEEMPTSLENEVSDSEEGPLDLHAAMAPYRLSDSQRISLPAEEQNKYWEDFHRVTWSLAPGGRGLALDPLAKECADRLRTLKKKMIEDEIANHPIRPIDSSILYTPTPPPTMEETSSDTLLSFTDTEAQSVLGAPIKTEELLTSASDTPADFAAVSDEQTPPPPLSAVEST